jgi:hypothetical protein
MGMSMSVNLDTTLSHSSDILYAQAGTDGVMMNVETGRYYGLNSVAARIWEQLERPRTIAELCALVREEFEVDAQTCEAEVLKFVNELVANGIVHEVTA